MAMEVLRKIKDALTGRDVYVARLEALEQEHAAAGAERQRAIAAAQAEVDRIEAPRRRLERLQAEDLAASGRESRDRDHAIHQVREHPSPELTKFSARLARVYERARLTDPPSMKEEFNRLTDERRVTNLPEIEAPRPRPGVVADKRRGARHVVAPQR
jgi:hypothetical protein